MSPSIRRLELEDFAPLLRERLAPKIRRLGYLGEFFKCAANQPALLAPFLEMTDAFKDTLPQKLIEVGALTVSLIARNDYERHQHERLCLALGYARDWIAEVERLDPAGAASMDPAEKAVQRLAIALLDRLGNAAELELDAAIAAIGPEQTVAVLFLVGRYLTHALIVNALTLAPPVPSIFTKAET